MMRGMNMQQMMKQAKAMQKKMMAEHEELAKQEFVGKAPDDICCVKNLPRAERSWQQKSYFISLSS